MLHHLPTINAILNTLAACFLVLGYRAIKRKAILQHRTFMLCALAASALFLVSYVTYHFLVPGVTRYQGTGSMRTLYFAILLTHTPAATMMVPFILAAVYFAFRRDFRRHVMITRWIYPVWMYVSVTGVLIYLMLYILPGGRMAG